MTSPQRPYRTAIPRISVLHDSRERAYNLVPDIEIFSIDHPRDGLPLISAQVPPDESGHRRTNAYAPIEGHTWGSHIGIASGPRQIGELAMEMARQLMRCGGNGDAVVMIFPLPEMTASAPSSPRRSRSPPTDRRHVRFASPPYGRSRLRLASPPPERWRSRSPPVRDDSCGPVTEPEREPNLEVMAEQQLQLHHRLMQLLQQPLAPDEPNQMPEADNDEEIGELGVGEPSQ
ncbi:hypothetical protein N3K66_008746 [Trichothecium roseum]|uniref:Uncharacterized protein n=1 Tax=Trichothecium roseum TaxID=47278 RepID=A0ACC0USR5_9HYPO|nr:hypothetical protein N3K66_008746 [Trichothecium roseum]